MITHIGNTTIVPLDAVTAHDRARSGGKAFNCARLKQAGFPVPDGVIVLSTATDADVAAVADHPWFDAQPAGRILRRSFVRNRRGWRRRIVRGHSRDVPGCSARRVSLTPFSDAGRRRLRFRHSNIAARRGWRPMQIEIGVLIQRMIHPVAAGVVFTVNPVTGARDELVVNASWGLGEALVSGQVDPDEFVVRKSDAHVRWSRIGEKGGGAAGASLTGDGSCRADEDGCGDRTRVRSAARYRVVS